MVTVTEKKDNHLVGRVEVKAHMEYNGATPSNDTVRKELAQEFKADEKLVVVKHIYTSFGKQEAEISAFIYNSLELRNEFEPALKATEAKAAEEAKKKAAEEKKKADEAAAAAPKEEIKPAEKLAETKSEEKLVEAPAEEKKEETPAPSKAAEAKPTEEKKAEEPAKEA